MADIEKRSRNPLSAIQRLRNKRAEGGPHPNLDSCNPFPPQATDDRVVEITLRREDRFQRSHRRQVTDNLC